MNVKALLYDLLAILAFVCFYLLGRYVVAHGEPAMFWSWEPSLVNHSTLIAWWLTWVCYTQVLIPICVGLLILAWLAPAWRTRALVSIGLLLVCWRGADLFQHFFARPRRLDWVVKHETSGSYPSSHAAIAFGFYGFWAFMLYWSELPVTPRRIGALLLAILTVGICWARLALGAHYFTDLVGGALLAIAFGSAVVAFAPSAFVGRVTRRLSSSAE